MSWLFPLVRRPKIACFFGGSLLVACGRIGYEPLDQAPAQPVISGSDAESGGGAGAPGTGGIPGTGGSASTGGSANGAGAPSTGGGAGEGASGAGSDAGPDVLADISQSDATAAVDCRTGTCRRVFVTSTFTGSADLGGLAGADATCQSLANGRSLGGTFKAWLSDASASPATRFAPSLVPYRLLDGTLVATNWADLTDGALAHIIDVDETGTHVGTVTQIEVWTGTSPSGAYEGDSCVNWTRNATRPFVGQVGVLNMTDARWSAVYLQFCDRTDVRLYCFEQ